MWRVGLLAALIVLSVSCGGAVVGAPFNTDLARNFKSGTATSAQVLAALGSPFEANPTVGSCGKGDVQAEVWTYVYADGHNSCSTVFYFDARGKLCKAGSSAPKPGPLCRGKVP